MQVCTSLQTDTHASTAPLSFLQAGRPYCRPTNSVKALKAQAFKKRNFHINNNVHCEEAHPFCGTMKLGNEMSN